jgi:hypothetical protein
MSKTFGDLIRDKVEVYVDDIVVKTKRMSTLVEDLTLVFDKLRATRTKAEPGQMRFWHFRWEVARIPGFVPGHRSEPREDQSN